MEAALIRTGTQVQYNELLNNLDIKETVLKDQNKTKTGVLRIRLENLVNVVQ